VSGPSGRAWQILAVVALPAVLVAAFLYPLLSTPFQLQVGTLIVVYTLAVAGLDVLAGRAGLLHLGYGVVFGSGAYTVAYLAQHYSGPVILTVILGAVVAALGAALLGLLLGRASGYVFAVLTLAAASALASVVSNVSWLGGTSGLGGVSRDLFGTGELDATGVYLVICAITLVVLVLYARFRRTRTGRAIEALRLVPEVARSSDVDLTRLRLKLTVLSGAIGGLAGGLYAVLQQYVSADVIGATQSVNLLGMNIIGGAGTAWAGIPGALVAVGLPQEIQSLVAYQLIIVGCVMAVVALRLRRGVAGTLTDGWRRALDDVAPRLLRGTPPAPEADAGRTARRPRENRGEALEVAGIAVTFGGVRALKGISLRLEPGRVHALVGPNGSGKSTLVGVVSGAIEPTAGTVRLGDRDISVLPAHRRAALGITRTFQLVALCSTLTVLENVMLGAHGEARGGFVRDFLSLPARRAEHDVAARAMRTLAELGAPGIAASRPAVLTSGHQRLAEIARCLMSDANVILLDEPAAGLSATERDHLAGVVRRLADEGRTVLLIEHDMEFVMSLADRITVLCEGAVLTDGLPGHVRDDPAVIEAYWGAEAAA
jgi:ABC-type branched-subunit amino acid transport system ATPase component/ABC-type branched-subunit amino acid transport system permease subunit